MAKPETEMDVVTSGSDDDQSEYSDISTRSSHCLDLATNALRKSKEVMEKNRIETENVALLVEVNGLKKQNETLRKEIHLLKEAIKALQTQKRPPKNVATKKRKKDDETNSSSEEEKTSTSAARKCTTPRQTEKDETSEEDPYAYLKPTTKPPSRKSESERTAEPANNPKIPPVVLRKKERWTDLSKLMKKEGINYKKAELIGDGITVTPSTVRDYRKMTATLNKNKEEYHTYTLQEDRLLRIVLRGIPEGIEEAEIAEDLKQQGFAPMAVHRMESRRTKQKMPLVLVKVPPSQTKILEINRCCHLVVKAEKQRTQQQATQCHRCQKFGHGQSRCTAQLKCVKCGEDHNTQECKKKKEEPD